MSTDPRNKTKRRLLDITVEEVSLVDKGAIDRRFVIVKNAPSEAEEANMSTSKVKKAREKNGMSLDKLATVTGIDLGILTKAEDESDDGLSEDDFTKIASALDIAKFEDGEGDDEEKDAEEAPAPENGEDAAKEAPPEKDPAADPKAAKNLISEKLAMIAQTATDLVEALNGLLGDAGGPAPDGAPPEEMKSADGKPAESEDPVSKIAKALVEALAKAKPDEKQTDLQKALATNKDLMKRLEALEKSGVSRSLGPDGKEPAKLKKDADSDASWSSWFGDDK